MIDRFTLSDVSSESVMLIAKIVSSSPSVMLIDDIAKSSVMRFGKSYLNSVLTACIQLEILLKDGQGYTVNTKFRDSIKRANKDELLPLFRQALQDYPPFLMYADFVSNGFSSIESATMISGIMQIQSNPEKIEKSLRNWGMDSGLIEQEGDKLRIPRAEKGLPSNYVKELLVALDSEFQTKMFLINTLDPDVYNCLTTLGMDINDLAKALISYEIDPKQSMEKALSFFELFLHKFGSSIGVNVQGKNGVNALVNEIFLAGKILKNQQHVGNGLGGCRNISAHGMDKDTGKEWKVTPQASLSSMLMIPIAMRSFYYYIKKQTQEF